MLSEIEAHRGSCVCEILWLVYVSLRRGKRSCVVAEDAVEFLRELHTAFVCRGFLSRSILITAKLLFFEIDCYRQVKCLVYGVSANLKCSRESWC